MKESTSRTSHMRWRMKITRLRFADEDPSERTCFVRHETPIHDVEHEKKNVTNPDE